MDKCLFCAITAGKVPAHVVYEDERIIAFLDIHPNALGHTLIIPRTHAARIDDLSAEDAAALFTALHKLTKPIREAVEAEATTTGINDGPGSGQEVPHVHIHVIPRRGGDGGGIGQRNELHARAKHADLALSEVSFAGHCEKIRAATKPKPLALVNGFRTLAAMQVVVDRGIADVISMSRPFIREPDLVMRLQAGQQEASCIRCDACEASDVFGKKMLRCRVE